MKVAQNPDKSLWQINFVLYLLSLILFGFLICKHCLCQQDICYILALGRWITEHRGLPQTDPFSWTYAIYPNGLPYVVHQWLTDVLFFLTVKNLQANALVFATATILSLSCIFLPSQILRCFHLNVGERLSLLSLSMLSAETHLQTRPELFSYIFLALYFLILVKSDQKNGISKLNMFWLFIIMIFWCNLHSGFLAGLALLSLWFFLSLSDQLSVKKINWKIDYIVATLICSLASLINPSGYKLWLYLPSLYLSPISHYISEWRSVDQQFLFYRPFYPFLILIIIFTVLAYKTIRTNELKNTGLKPIILGLTAIIISFFVSRFMNIASFALIVSIGMFLKNRQFNKQTDYLKSFSLPSIVIVIAITIIVTSKLIPAQIGHNCREFTAPFKAMDFLSNHPQTGQLLNDPQYGDFLLWYMRPCPKLCIDSRFDLYSPEMIDKYFKLIECKSEWRNLLQYFNPDWIFLPPYFPLITALSNDADWKVVYRDYTAVILHRK